MGRRDPASVLRLIIEKPGCARSDSRTWCGRHPRRSMFLVVRFCLSRQLTRWEARHDPQSVSATLSDCTRETVNACRGTSLNTSHVR